MKCYSCKIEFGIWNLSMFSGHFMVPDWGTWELSIVRKLPLETMGVNGSRSSFSIDSDTRYGLFSLFY